MKTRCIQSYKFKVILDFFRSLANTVIIQHVHFYGCQMVELLERYARLWVCLLLDVWNNCSGHVTGTVRRNFMKFPSRSRHWSICRSQFPCFSLVGIADKRSSLPVQYKKVWSCPLELPSASQHHLFTTDPLLHTALQRFNMIQPMQPSKTEP